MRPVVVLTDRIAPAPLARLEQVAEVRLLANQQPKTYREALRGAHFLVVRNNVPLGVLTEAGNLLGVVRHGVGLDMIPMEEANALGLPVANVPGGNAIAVAEYTVIAMGLLTRQLRELDACLRTQGWATARAMSDGIHNLSGKTVGIVGVGDVGGQIANLCHAGFRMKVLGHRRNVDALPAFVEAASVDDIFRRADFVVLACPLTAQTHHLCNAARLALMKADACLVNVGRGGLVDTDALLAALDSGRLGGLVCDVYEEQPLRPDHPLLAHPRALLTPHAAGLTVESTEYNSTKTVDQLLALMAGRAPEHLVNAPVWAKAQARLLRVLPR